MVSYRIAAHKDVHFELLAWPRNVLKCLSMKTSDSYLYGTAEAGLLAQL